jgi:preprotein translocase subunit SecD
MFLAAIFGSFMAAFSSGSSALVEPKAIVQVITLGSAGTANSDELQLAAAIIRKRLDGLGLAQATVEVGENAIQIGLPSVENFDEVVTTLSARGLLEFVDFSNVPDFAEWKERKILTTGQGAHPISADAALNPVTNRPFETIITGDDVNLAKATLYEDFNQWRVSIEFTEEAGKILGDYTRTHLGKPLAIVLDGTVLSIPVIQAELSTQAEIAAGDFTEQSAQRLAVQLGSGALPFAMVFESVAISQP